MTTPQACKEALIAAQTFCRWRKEFGGLKLDQAKRLKEPDRENARIKQLVAVLSLEEQILKDLAEGNFQALRFGGNTKPSLRVSDFLRKERWQN
jgi:putative transposase